MAADRLDRVHLEARELELLDVLVYVKAAVVVCVGDNVPDGVKVAA